MLFTCLFLLACPFMNILAQVSEEPDNPTTPFPPDPGVVYVPPVVVIMGDTIDMSDTTAVIPEEIDFLGDSTIVYKTEENVLVLTGASLGAGDSLTAAISYTGSDTLTIVLCDTSTIVADTVISSQSDIVIKGEGSLTIEGDVPIIGAPTATIRFDSVTMYVHSLPGPAAVRRRVRGLKVTDEDGGPALSGFAGATFNNTSVTPPEADYGEVDVADAAGIISTINALFTTNADGERDPVTEFWLTAKGGWSAVTNTKVRPTLDTNKPMFNIIGMPVDASYKGIVIQNGRKYILK